MSGTPGSLSRDYQPLCQTTLSCMSSVNTACYQNCEPCRRMFNVIPVRSLLLIGLLQLCLARRSPDTAQGELGDYRFTRFFFIQSSIQFAACVLCLAFLWFVYLSLIALLSLRV